MTRFAYKAIPTTTGAHRAAPGPQGAAGRATAHAGAAPGAFVTGRMEASDESALRDRLRAQGLIPIDVRPVSAVDAVRAAFRGGRLKRQDSAWFFQTMRRLLAGKVPIESALGTMRELAPKPRIAQACAEVREALRSGSSLADAVERVSGLADAQHIALLRVGHESGRLRHAVDLIEQSMRVRDRMRKTVVSQLVYPAILVVVAIGAVWFLSSFVIPRFADTLSSVGAELPMSTEITLAASRWLVWVVPPLAVLAAVLAWSQAVVVPPAARQWLDRTTLKMPVVGPLRWHGQAAIIADTLATMIEGGGDVLAGMDQAGKALTSGQIRDRLEQARRAVREGVELGEALDRLKVLPPMVAAIVRVGMTSGDLIGALRGASELCIERQEETAGRLLTLMGPAIILFLAAMVGWVIYSLFAGILTMNQVGA